ncbi:hypothetical protein C8Q79DRAFT_181819 [Trametes meyenii]|nr:hypothetical protein C8Q79DRAFT_181819 [Trametes meyenii]
MVFLASLHRSAPPADKPNIRDRGAGQRPGPCRGPAARRSGSRLQSPDLALLDRSWSLVVHHALGPPRSQAHTAARGIAPMAAPRRLTTYDLPLNNVDEAVDRDMGAAASRLRAPQTLACRPCGGCGTGTCTISGYVVAGSTWRFVRNSEESKASWNPLWRLEVQKDAHVGMLLSRASEPLSHAPQSCSSALRIPRIRTALRGYVLFHFRKGSVTSDGWGRLIGCSARRIPLTGQCRSPDRTLHASLSSQSVRGPPDRKALQNALPPTHERRRRCDVTANSHAPSF